MKCDRRTREPTKMVTNMTTAPTIESELTSFSVKERSVVESTMATASLSTDSPNTIENRSTLTPSAYRNAMRSGDGELRQGGMSARCCVEAHGVARVSIPNSQHNAPTRTWNTASTVTGSVAEMSEPKVSADRRPSG